MKYFQVTFLLKRNRQVSYDNITDISKSNNKIFITDIDGCRFSNDLEDIIDINIFFSDEV